ncbi:MAG: CehA/McbA family metallohydrolase [Acidobacteria bacterium]|nr:CehA/McbA family metallohydrolase [Acidobacteriota bacterium]
MKRGLLWILCSSVAICFVASAQAQPRWFKGNTHTHTINSDGDSSPDAVVRWYKEHGYNFIVLSDHTYIDRGQITPVDGLNAVFALPGTFLVLSGVEVTDRVENAQVHLIGVGVRETVLAKGGATRVEALQSDARAIRAAGGLPHINHPNWVWSLTAQDLIAATEAKHFELMNGHSGVNNFGGGSTPSTEEMWDTVLSTGRVLYGMGTDDAHDFKGELRSDKQNPGRAWVMVRATELSREALLAALDRGDFYSSTGVTLKSYEADAREIRIELPEDASRNALRYRTYFIGKDGAVLKRDETLQPAYQFKGDELYVRARIEASNGSRAWTQPVFLKKP